MVQYSEHNTEWRWSVLKLRLWKIQHQRRTWSNLPASSVRVVQTWRREPYQFSPSIIGTRETARLNVRQTLFNLTFGRINEGNKKKMRENRHHEIYLWNHRARFWLNLLSIALGTENTYPQLYKRQKRRKSPQILVSRPTNLIYSGLDEGKRLDPQENGRKPVVKINSNCGWKRKTRRQASLALWLAVIPKAPRVIQSASTSTNSWHWLDDSTRNFLFSLFYTFSPVKCRELAAGSGQNCYEKKVISCSYSLQCTTCYFLPPKQQRFSESIYLYSLHAFNCVNCN